MNRMILPTVLLSMDTKDSQPRSGLSVRMILSKLKLLLVLYRTGGTRSLVSHSSFFYLVPNLDVILGSFHSRTPDVMLG